MKAFLAHTSLPPQRKSIQITGSKSESNRLLLLQALYPNLQIENLSKSDDTQYLQRALSTPASVVDVHHAGTAMRFLTAYFACKEGAEVLLTGSPRMQERPIEILVDALRQMGAEIAYVQNEGFPPLRITGKRIHRDKVTIAAHTSSQYISALMLVAPSLPKGLTIFLEGTVTSTPYIAMTLALLKRIGVSGSYTQNTIQIAPQKTIKDLSVHVESDWSSASYFYSIVALSNGWEISLRNYRKDSLQGDVQLAKIYESFGVKTRFVPEEDAVVLSKTEKTLPKRIRFDLANTPDIAQTIAISCFGLGMGCHLTGLHTLKIKETDRLEALKAEIQKLGGTPKVDNNSLWLEPSQGIKTGITIHTYNDHRMAMAFAPLALRTSLVIDDRMVVTKSFPSFWDDLKHLGFSITMQ